MRKTLVQSSVLGCTYIFAKHIFKKCIKLPGPPLTDAINVGQSGWYLKSSVVFAQSLLKEFLTEMNELWLTSMK